MVYVSDWCSNSCSILCMLVDWCSGSYWCMSVTSALVIWCMLETSALVRVRLYVSVWCLLVYGSCWFVEQWFLFTV